MHFNVGDLRHFKLSIILDQTSKVYTIRLQRCSFLKSEFVAKTQFLYEEKMPMLKQRLKVKIEGWRETPWKPSIHMFLCTLYLDLSLMDPLLVCRLTSWTNKSDLQCVLIKNFLYICARNFSPAGNVGEGTKIVTLLH